MAGLNFGQMACDADSVVAVGRFEQQAASYARHAAIQQDMAGWLAQWLPQQHDAASMPHRVLDLGAGQGAFTRLLANRFSDVSALDSAQGMLEQGRHHLPQVQWLQGDAWTLAPLSDVAHRFDYVTSASLLQWCKLPQETLRHWAQSFAKGTCMLHGFYVEPTLHEWRSVFNAADTLGWHTQQQWQSAFAQAGWRVRRSEGSVRRYHFSNALELARSLHGTGAVARSGQLAAGRFRTLLRQYDTDYTVANLPRSEPLHQFGAAAMQADALQQGVYASWAFFRIEVELV